jgi:excisionase family DNA binding protein
MNSLTAELLANETLTPAEVQRILRASRSTIDRGLRDKTIPHFHLGRSVKIPTQWLRALLLAA